MSNLRHSAGEIPWPRIFRTSFLFLFVAYPGVSLQIMKTFKCREVEGEHFLVADMRLKCYEGEWYGYALYALIMGCLFTAGLPLIILTILLKNRLSLNSPPVREKWGFLYEMYGERAYLWEVEELMRKLWLSALVVLLDEGSPLQITCAVLVCGWAHVIHAVYKPWKDSGMFREGVHTYALQHASLFVTAFVFLMGLLFKMDGVSTSSLVYALLPWVMLLLCAGFLALAVSLLAYTTAAKLRQRRQSPLAKLTRVPPSPGAPSLPASSIGIGQAHNVYRASKSRKASGASPSPAMRMSRNPMHKLLRSANNRAGDLGNDGSADTMAEERVDGSVQHTALRPPSPGGRSESRVRLAPRSIRLSGLGSSTRLQAPEPSCGAALTPHRARDGHNSAEGPAPGSKSIDPCGERGVLPGPDLFSHWKMNPLADPNSPPSDTE